MRNPDMGVNLISGYFRIFASIVQYFILLSVLATIPLYIKKSFQNPQIYSYYKLYWWVASIIFANIGLLLYHVQPSLKNEEYWFFMICLIIIILLPTLLPAAYQYHKKR